MDIPKKILSITNSKAIETALTNLSDDTGTRNISFIKNESRYDDMDFIQLIDIELFEKYYHNRAVSSATYWSLIVAYSLLIVAGSIGNLLVILAVVNNKSMKTARNIFIATLAVADSTLCLLTMPMTLLGVLTKYWPFGTHTWLLCKIVRTSPPITIFFSSYTMAFIAIDRQRFIVHSTKRQVSGSEAMGISFGLFIFSVVISIPFMISTKLKQMFDDPGEFDHIAFCVEDLPQIGQAMMSFGTVIVQYLVPCAIVTVSYSSICYFLSNQPIPARDSRQKQILAKRRRSNKMLIVVSVAHFMSWLPLNVANVIITSFDSEQTPLFQDVENLYITYAICHLASMTSAISNPILYGFMNENFRQEFSKIWNSLVRGSCATCRKSDNTDFEINDIPKHIGTSHSSQTKRKLQEV